MVDVGTSNGGSKYTDIKELRGSRVSMDEIGTMVVDLGIHKI